MKLRVLLVDDEKLVRKSLSELLPWADYGMEVAGEAGTGKDALTWLGQHPADIVFVDLSMPVMDGFELLKQLNRDYPGIVKIVLTCHAEVKYIQRTIEEGIAGYILKTDFDMEEIHKLLARARAQGERNRALRGCFGLRVYMGKEGGMPPSPFPGVEATPLTPRMHLLHSADSLMPLMMTLEEDVLVNLTAEQAEQLLQNPYRACEVEDRLLCYDLRATIRVYHLTALPELSPDAEAALEEKVSSGEWLLGREGCRALQAELAALYYPGSRLLAALDILLGDLQPALGEDVQVIRQALRAAPLPCWPDIRRGMDLFERAFDLHLKRVAVSAESAAGILRALHLLHDPARLFGRADDISTLVGFSRSHFSRSFTQMMGMSFREYTRRMRLEYVHRMMEEGLTISEIADRLNYTNAEYFLRTYNVRQTDKRTGGT